MTGGSKMKLSLFLGTRSARLLRDKTKKGGEGGESKGSQVNLRKKEKKKSHSR